MNAGELRRRRMAEKRLRRNQERPDWSPLHQDQKGKFSNQPWRYKKPSSPSYRRVQQPSQPVRSSNKGFSDPYLKHQNNAARNTMSAARQRYQDMKNNPGSYSSKPDNHYRPEVSKFEQLRLRREDDWNRKSQGLNPRQWGNLF